LHAAPELFQKLSSLLGDFNHVTLLSALAI